MTAKKKKPAKKKAKKSTAKSRRKLPPKRGTVPRKNVNKQGRPKHPQRTRARTLFVTSLGISLAEIAREVGVHYDTVRKWSAAESWTEKREQNRAKLVQDGLQQAMENHRAGVAALTHLEYQEALSIVTMLQTARRQAMGQGENGEPKCYWSPNQLLTYARAFMQTTKLARLSLGLPTEIQASPEEAARSHRIDYSSLSDEELRTLREISERARARPRSEGEDGESS